MRIIPLTQGFDTLVDDSDYDWISQFKWCAHRVSWGSGFHMYAWTKIPMQRCVHMHSMLLGNKPGFVIDHRDRNGLNNQRENLRHCTNSQNAMNSPPRSSNKTGMKGVTFHQGAYVAHIRINGKQTYIGRFSDLASAALAYNEMAFELEPEFAYLNPIPDGNLYGNRFSST